MGASVKHKFVCLIDDDPVAVEAGQIVPSNWNDEHEIELPQGLETTDSPTFDTIIMKSMNGLYYKLVIDPDGNIGTELMI